MLTPVQVHPSVHPSDPDFRWEIELELAALFGSPEFAASPRSRAFLRHVADCALDGRADLLKERTIGIAVFGRAASYDTGSDAAVRVRARDVRRRLREYYARRRPRGSWSIALHPGSYIPRWIPDGEAEAVVTYVPGLRPALVIQGANPDILRMAACRLGEALRDKNLSDQRLPDQAPHHSSAEVSKTSAVSITEAKSTYSSRL